MRLTKRVATFYVASVMGKILDIVHESGVDREHYDIIMEGLNAPMAKLIDSLTSRKKLGRVHRFLKARAQRIK